MDLAEDLARFGYAETARGAWLIQAMSQSTAPIPDVRKWALRESVRTARDDESIKSMLIDTLCGSQYIPEAHKAALGEILVFGLWDQLPKALSCPPEADVRLPLDAVAAKAKALYEFRQMALMIFTKSRKIAKLPPARRVQLGHAICRTRSKEELTSLMLASLENAVTLDLQSRGLVANDVLDGCFYKLLREDRFDCDELTRERVNPDHPSHPSYTEASNQNQNQTDTTVDTTTDTTTATAVNYSTTAVPCNNSSNTPQVDVHDPVSDLVNLPLDADSSTISNNVPSAPLMIEEFECPICLGVEPATVELRCGHKFCRGCITGWTRGESTFSCPMCRAEIQTSSIC
eukprot:m.262827 g.262827  ORF g.262827 m.262827 type:complete len:346 (-) comp47283_c0_seq1:112-1149(-)